MFRQLPEQRLSLVQQRHGELIHEAEQYRLARAHPFEMRPVRKETTMRSRVARLALVMFAGGVLATASLGVGVVSANSGQSHRDAEVTFTKWITTFPAMAGVDGGAVGPGAYSGEILKKTPGSVTVIDALYHINGSRHSFTALVEVKQTGLNAVILGVVTDGWEKGDLVNGEYTQVSCAHDGITTACFQGTLKLQPDSGR
jgi:hypothetical protein